MSDEKKERKLQASDPGVWEVKGDCLQDLKAVQEASSQGAADAQTKLLFSTVWAHLSGREASAYLEK